MKNTDPKMLEGFLDILKNRPDLILQGMRHERITMLLLYEIYNPCPFIFLEEEMDKFYNEWLEHLRARFLPQG